MLVYGDLERDEDAAVVAAEIGARLGGLQSLEAGLGRHQALVAAFVRSGELVQGVLDGQFHRAGGDDIGALQEAGAGLLQCLADGIAASWDSEFQTVGCQGWPEALALLSGAGRIRTRQAEGYAFYALYPEAYLVAARRSGLGPQTSVIGIRSIGVGLAAMVAAGLGAGTVHNVRPVGHPFDRRIVLNQRLAERLRAAPGDFAIVDEGPGLSGSSFNGVADWLVAQGIAESRIHFFPSHGGELGPAARADHRRRWSSARRHVVDFDALVLKAVRPAHRLDHWLSPLTGPVRQGLTDLSGGAWRGQAAGRSSTPADPAMERRKYLAVIEQGQWLAKFAGIGPSGEARLDLARRLAQAGFAPPPLGLCHGFLVTAWLKDDRVGGESVPIDRVADYLVFRAGLPADRAGAGLEQVFAMAAYNIGQVWGEAAEGALRAALGDPARFRPVPCCSDNRMQAWEWLCHDGQWLKLDALDHHAAHDLIGCQDIAWDIAGAAVELNLTAQAGKQLAQTVFARIGRALPAEFLAVNTLCYLGFQIGLWTMARERAEGAERETIERQLDRYTQHPGLRFITAR